MTSAQGTPSRAAIYAQERRDNENEAREELRNRLPQDASVAEIESRGDLNMTTKVLAQALICIDPHAETPDPVNRLEYASNSIEYNQLRRSNEAEVREALRARIPEHILAHDFMQFGHLNQTTKIIVAAARLLDELQHILSAPGSQAPLSLPKQLSQHSGMSPSLRSPEVQDSQDPVPLSSQSSSSPATQDSPTPTTSQKRSLVNIDPLSNLKLNLDVKPPSMPNKKNLLFSVHNNEAQRLWELAPIEEHPVQEIQHLEQVAKRLVAKAKMMIEPSEEPHWGEKAGYLVQQEDVTCEKKRDLEWITDLMIDAITVIEGKGEKKKVMKQWTIEQVKWAKEYDLQ